MPPGSDVIRELLVQLGVIGDDEAVLSLERVEAAADRTRNTLQGMATAAAGVIAGLGALASAGVALAVGAANNAEALQQQAEALDSNVEELQELQFAFSEVAGGGELLGQVLFSLQGRASDAAEGNEALAETFRAVGVSANQLKSLRPAELFERIADTVQRADDRGEALAATMRLLGEDVARRVAPLLVQGSDGLRSLRNEAQELGVVTRAETIAATAELAVQWRQLTSVGRALRDEIGAALSPTVSRLVGQLLEWVKANRELISSRLQTFVEGVTQLFVDWAPIIGLVSLEVLALATAVGTLLALPLVAAFVAANPVFAAVAVTIAGLTALVVSLSLAYEDLQVYLQGGNSLLGRFKEWIDSVVPGTGDYVDVLAALADVFASLVGLGGRALASLAQWSLEAVKAHAATLPLVNTIRSLWAILTQTLSSTWLQDIAQQLRIGADVIDAVQVPGPRNSTVNNTTNSRVDVNQTFNVNGATASEEVPGLMRVARDAAAGGIR